ncbi:MAG: LysR family transcriptional regulator [Saccharospirillaceae bacterium]|nr:LysR family transcriptional regulator [Pseudomonadales bacterium]NRB80990.1 LysR family transcriptional regulator [Saccharospirillaceae bacterium]
MNWDDLKYFLAVAREGSVRAAAKKLEVNHATVSRRIKHFEEALGEQLFDRTQGGYQKTLVAEEIYQEALHLEERMYNVSRKIASNDQTLKGDIRLTVPEGFVETLLIKGLAQFCDTHKQINLEILSSTRTLNLTNREADVAIRICKNPPEHLVGKKIAVMHRAVYIAKTLEDKIHDEDFLKTQNWLGFSSKARKPIGLIAKEYPRFNSRHYFLDIHLQIAAVKNQMGVGIIPCFAADNDPDLVRLPPYISEPKYDIWLLYHPDLRKSKKIQTFVQFLYEQFKELRPLIGGERYKSN